MEQELEFWMMIRQALLMFVDAIEIHKLKMTDRTSDLRKKVRELSKRVPPE